MPYRRSGDQQLRSGGIRRFPTLRAWLSQWSIDDSNVRRLHGAAAITVPLLVVQNSADEAAPASDSVAIHQATRSADKTFHVIKGATHYYQGQPELQRQATTCLLEWLGQRGLLD